MVDDQKVNVQHLLVGGWATPLKNMSSSIGMIIDSQYEWENAKFTTNQTYWHDPI